MFGLPWRMTKCTLRFLIALFRNGWSLMRPGKLGWRPIGSRPILGRRSLRWVEHACQAGRSLSRARTRLCLPREAFQVVRSTPRRSAGRRCQVVCLRESYVFLRIRQRGSCRSWECDESGSVGRAPPHVGSLVVAGRTLSCGFWAGTGACPYGRAGVRLTFEPRVAGRSALEVGVGLFYG